MNKEEVKALAEKHGLQISEDLVFNEMGLDFQIAFAADQDGARWVLRIPRRPNMFPQIEHEAKILSLVKKRLRILVPDWKIVSPELIAYPLLPDQPAISFDPATYEIHWNIDRESKNFIVSLAQILVDLHGTPLSEVEKIGLKSMSALEAWKKLDEDTERVKRELGMSSSLERRLRAWIDNDKQWPGFSVFVHGDLYAGHILAKKDGCITGMIDWSEVAMSDPAIDFTGHLAVFGEESLKALINEYEKAGGRTWDRMLDQVKERHFASFLKFAVFALDSGLDEHIATAKRQLHERPL